MNREIKFRMWCNGWMDNTPSGIELIDGKISNTWELMQYTGIKDATGREIYEGDIVRHTAFNDFGDKVQEVTKVKDLRVFYHHMMYLQNGKNDMEIIGNIYENEELLK